MLSATGGQPFWRLIDPYGGLVFGPNNLLADDVGTRTLALSGRYTLLIEGRRDADANTAYSNNVKPGLQTSNAYVVCAHVSASIATAAASAAYNLTLALHSNQDFDSQLKSSDFKW